MISDFVNIYVKQVYPNSIIFTRKTWGWCRMPYQDHPRGCPNFGKNPNCPPNSKYMEDIKLNFSYFYLIYADFDFRKYKDDRKDKLVQKYKEKLQNGEWNELEYQKKISTLTERSIGNLLYWQKPVKNLLKKKVSEIENKKFHILGCGSGFWDNIYSMESAGIDVYSTLRNNSIFFEENPINHVVLVSLIYLNEKIRFRKMNSIDHFLKK